MRAPAAEFVCLVYAARLMMGAMSELRRVEMLGGDAVKIVGFLREIGLGVRLAALEGETFLPGVSLEPGGLVVDAEKLLYPGDLLHEAGHLAVMLPEVRRVAGPDVGIDMGDEIAAQCWSYAAAVHLGLAAEVVFHEHGYHDSAETLIGVYREGRAGVALLQWMGMTLEAKRAAEAAVPGWPSMKRWLRADAEV